MQGEDQQPTAERLLACIVLSGAVSVSFPWTNHTEPFPPYQSGVLFWPTAVLLSYADASFDHAGAMED